MKRHSPRVLAIGSAVVLVLAACGDDDGSVTSSTDDRRAPVAVEVGAVGGSGATAEAAAAGTPGGQAGDAAPPGDLSTLPMWGGFVYEVGEGLPALPTADTGYEFPPGSTVDVATVTDLAAALGVDGEPVAGSGRDGDGTLWRVGPDDGTAASVTVIDDGQLTWYLSSAWALQPGFECEIVTSGDEGTTDDEGTTEERCPEPVAPDGVPTAAEAEQRVTELLSTLEVDPATVEFETYADEWAASVTVWQLRDGIRWPISWGFGFGADGVLQWASGILAVPVATGPYPLVDLDTAIARLDEQSGWWGVFSIADAAMIEPGMIEPGTTPAEPEPVTAVLVDVRADLWWVWDTDATVWLLPAYTFTDTEGISHTVPAVTDEFITFADPVDRGIPLPVEPVDPVIVDPPAGSDPGDPFDPLDPVDPETPEVAAIVGSSVDEATATLEAQGLSLRVARLDGEDLMLTMDFVPTRVNVAVEADVVVEIISVG